MRLAGRIYGNHADRETEMKKLLVVAIAATALLVSTIA
jgi:hypothetical protein